MHMKFHVPWLFLSESVVYFLPLFISFIENHNKDQIIILEKFVVNGLQRLLIYGISKC